MANPNFPRGFIPVRYRTNQELVCDEGDLDPANSAIGVNDLIERRANGYLNQAQASSTTIIGVAAEKKAASAGGTILFYPVENLLMHAQVNDATVDAQTDFDLVYNITVTTPDATTGQSRMQIDGASQAATATLPIKILRVVPFKGTENNLGANVVVECVVNTGVIKGAGTVG